MPYIIDGHNLIPRIPGIELDDLDDEKELIKLLQGFLSRANKKAHLYFDRASTGHSHVSNHGRVTARYVTQRKTADEAIASHLKRLGAEARNWTVVSSDHEVISSAKSARSKTLSSQEFADQILNQGPSTPIDREDAKLDDQDVDEWMKLFEDK